MKSARNIRFCLVLAVCLVSFSCAGLFQNYGHINPDEAATRVFESYSVNPDFSYYISGSDTIPNAIIGLRRDRHLDQAALWKEVQMTPERMKQVVDSMKRKARESNTYQHGFAMTDDQGRQLGVWYSILEARTFVHILENGTVRIDSPPLNLYDRFEVEEGRDK